MPVLPALDFSAASSRATTASLAAIPTTVTTIAWINMAATGGGTARGIVGCIAAPIQGWLLMNQNLSDAFEMIMVRATTNLQVTASAASFTNFSTSKWVCMVSCMDTTGGATNQRLLCGDLYNAPAEPSSYNTQAVGSGGVSFTAQPIVLGAASSTGTFNFPGLISAVGMWNRLLSMTEIQRYRFELLKRWPRMGNPFAYWNRVGLGVKAQDYGGRALHATVTNAVMAGGLAVPQSIVG